MSESFGGRKVEPPDDPEAAKEKKAQEPPQAFLLVELRSY